MPPKRNPGIETVSMNFSADAQDSLFKAATLHVDAAEFKASARIVDLLLGLLCRFTRRLRFEVLLIGDLLSRLGGNVYVNLVADLWHIQA